MPLAEFSLANQKELETLASRLEPQLRPGDVLGLMGGLGVGKSVFARAIIRAGQTRLGLAQESIPSPSFSLMQFYPRPSANAVHAGIWHADLWRLGDDSDKVAAEAEALGLMEGMAHHLCLIEWADKLAEALPAKTLCCRFAFAHAHRPQARQLSLTTAPEFAEIWHSRLVAMGL